MIKYIVSKFQTKNLYFFISITFTLLMLCMLSLKVNFFIDETYSYGLANNIGGPAINFEDGIKYNPNIFYTYLTVDESHRFNFANVWSNQASDVHPPLYYAILHTICSLFPETFSIWYAGIINIIFSLATLFVIQKLCMQLTSDLLICNLLSSTFILLSVILLPTAFLRMYVLAMFWVTLFAYLFVKKIGQPDTWHFYLSVCIIAILSALTHYYCIIFVILVSIVYGFYILIQKKWKNLFLFCGTMVSTGILSLAIFPSMLRHMFFGDRGTEALNNLSEFSDYLTRLKTFFNIINNQLFGGILQYIFIIILLHFVFILLFQKKHLSNLTVLKTRINPILLMKYLILIIPSILFFMIVSKIAAYQTERYMSPIFAVTFVWIFCLIFNYLNKIRLKITLLKKYFFLIACLLLLITVIGSWQKRGWSYLYRNSIQLLETSKEYTDLDCICIYNQPFETQASFLELTNYNSITFISEDNLDLLYTIANNSSKLILIIINDKEQDTEAFLNKLLSEYPLPKQHKFIGHHAYGTSFYVYE